MLRASAVRERSPEKSAIVYGRYGKAESAANWSV